MAAGLVEPAFLPYIDSFYAEKRPEHGNGWFGLVVRRQTRCLVIDCVRRFEPGLLARFPGAWC